jgi:CheY-like chemotaxis protein
MQGGGIGVQSTKGIGSTFSFYIKSRRAAPPHPSCNGVKLPTRIKTNGTQNGGLCRTQQPTEPQSYSNYHILVVEDNLINQRVLCSQLKKLGCTVYVANHGREALDEVHKSTYAKQPTMSPPRALSVVLMDVEMPVMDGNACTRRIRELEEEGDIVGHVPIIAVSANARREQIEQAKQAGMDDAISKPFRIPALLSIIHKVLGERAE